MEVGYRNGNQQTVLRPTGLQGTGQGETVYVLRCHYCKHEYGADGSDIHLRRCPVCQGGAPGLHYNRGPRVEALTECSYADREGTARVFAFSLPIAYQISSGRGQGSTGRPGKRNRA